MDAIIMPLQWAPVYWRGMVSSQQISGMRLNIITDPLGAELRISMFKLRAHARIAGTMSLAKNHVLTMREQAPRQPKRSTHLQSNKEIGQGVDIYLSIVARNSNGWLGPNQSARKTITGLCLHIQIENFQIRRDIC